MAIALSLSDAAIAMRLNMISMNLLFHNNLFGLYVVTILSAENIHSFSL